MKCHLHFVAGHGRHPAPEGHRWCTRSSGEPAASFCFRLEANAPASMYTGYLASHRRCQSPFAAPELCDTAGCSGVAARRVGPDREPQPLSTFHTTSLSGSPYVSLSINQPEDMTRRSRSSRVRVVQIEVSCQAPRSCPYIPGIDLRSEVWVCHQQNGQVSKPGLVSCLMLT
jgi:hypothetical protein